MIINEFKSPLDTHKLTSFYGYVYGKCPRQLHYASKEGQIGFNPDEIKAMHWGKENHLIIQNWLGREFPEKNFRFEQHYEREINPVGGINTIGATYDVVGHKMAIEIKPLYSIKAYVQIKIQAFVNPTWEYFVFQYLNVVWKKSIREIMFKVKSGTEKDSIYIARIITALNNRPPRFPFASKTHPVCKSCLFNQRCYDDSQMTWETFRNISQSYISKLG